MTMTTDRAGELALNILSSEFSADLRQFVQRWFITLRQKGIESGEAVDLLELMLPALLKNEVQQFIDLKKGVEANNPLPTDVDPSVPRDFPLEKMIRGIADECASLFGIDASIIKGVALRWLKQFAPEGVVRTKLQSFDEECTGILSHFLDDVEEHFKGSGINAGVYLERLADQIGKRVKKPAEDPAPASNAASSSSPSSSQASEPVAKANPEGDLKPVSSDANPTSSTASESNTGPVVQA